MTKNLFFLKSESLAVYQFKRFFWLEKERKNLIAADSNKCAKASSTQKFGIFCIILCVASLWVGSGSTVYIDSSIIETSITIILACTGINSFICRLAVVCHCFIRTNQLRMNLSIYLTRAMLEKGVPRLLENFFLDQIITII